MEIKMNAIEIALLIIGIIIIIISCRIIDRSQPINQTTARTLSIDHSLSEEDKKQLMNKMEELLSEASEDAIVKTDDTLSKLSNEKIMAVHEFSDQIMEKIKRNHEEVVFLYNMLNDKEKELKAAVKEIDTSKKKVQDILEAKSEQERIQKSNDKKAPAGKTTGKVVSTAPTEKAVKPMQLTEETLKESSTLDSLISNNNKQILDLYSRGKSVIEISKLLGLGQGEVKLVIDLFKGKK